MTREPLPFLKCFVVTANTKAGDFAPFTPTITVDGPLINASASPSSDARMTPAWVGTTIPTTPPRCHNTFHPTPGCPDTPKE